MRILLRRTRSCAGAVGALALLGALTCCSSSSSPAPAGDPDPGHRLLAALRPVAAAVPAGVSDAQRQFVEPRWDSCDGVASTYGWDDVTVDVSFNSNGMTDTAIFTHIKDALRSDGWTYENTSDTGAWYWKRNVAGGHHAVIQLLGGSEVNPPNPWDLQATTPAATHPVKGC
jgi:hypothetical protein